MFEVKDYNQRITLDYEYITDPPVLADVGTFELDIQNADLKTEIFFLFEDGILNADITFFDVFLDPIFVDFDGMSDISEFLSQNLNFAKSASCFVETLRNSANYFAKFCKDGAKIVKNLQEAGMLWNTIGRIR